MKRVLLLIIAGLVFGGSALPYVRLTTPSGQTPRWPRMPIRYSINTLAKSLPNGSDFVAVREAFRTWESVPSADISFDYRGTTQVNEVGLDGTNLVSFFDDSTPLGSSTLASTFLFFSSENGTSTIREADILFSRSVEWTTSGETGRFDIQGILTHEAGHFLGLDHSGLVSSVMTPFATANQIDDRILQYDDIAGISEIYPGSQPAVGSVRGSIRSATQAIFGAHVVAVDANGTPRVSTLSQKDGSYLIRFLPPGDYRIYAEPVDGPLHEDDIGGWYGTLSTNFGTTYFGNVPTLSNARTVPVSIGNTPSVADIQVLARSGTGLNIDSPGSGIRLSRGETRAVTFRGTDIRSGLVFSSSTSGIVLGTPVYANSSTGGSARISISASSSAILGPKNIAANRVTDTTVASGVIVVTDSPPPVVSISPAVGFVDGGERVVIRGDDFRSGVRVFFGGLPSTDVRVISSTMLDVLTPPNTSGEHNVQVVNADGTNGVLPRGYAYTTTTPRVWSISPTEGPAGTVLTINGDSFGSNPATTTVSFKGVQGQITSVTPTRIEVVVPDFGGGSAQVSVHVLGVPSPDLPTFVQTSVAPSGPRISSISPASGPAGMVLKIEGSGFGLDPGVASVSMGSYQASILSVDSGRMEVRVPIYLGTGPVPVQLQILGTPSSDTPTYTVTQPDDTQPMPPLVVDGGTVTNSMSELSASWYSEDPDVGIWEYQYTIGTSPGLSDVYPNKIFSTKLNYATVRDLALISGETYYFTVRAISRTFTASQEAYSNGIRVDTAMSVPVKVLPFAPQASNEFTGIALLAPSAMTVAMKAVSDAGEEVATVTVELNPGQQYARLISELFGLSSFDGWVEIQPSAPGLGVYAATGSFDLSRLDGELAPDLMTDFVAMHPGSTLIMVNPSTEVATATLNRIGADTVQEVVVPARGRVKVVLPWIARVISSLPLAIVESVERSNRLSLAAPEAMQERSSLTFAQGVTGGGYSTTLTLVNADDVPVQATVSFASTERVVSLAPNSTKVLSLAEMVPAATAGLSVDGIRVTTSEDFKLFAAVDIENSVSQVSLGSRTLSTEFTFPHVAHGGGLFTGLGFVAGSSGALVTVHVYSSAGDVVKTGSITLAAYQQLARVLDELIPSVTNQQGGYIRVVADHPILAWEIYGSENVFASAPPLPAN